MGSVLKKEEGHIHAWKNAFLFVNITGKTIYYCRLYVLRNKYLFGYKKKQKQNTKE